MDRKLWIIGDSFTGMYPDNWMQEIIKYFDGDDWYVSSNGGRDVQTIIDILLRNLKSIKKDDFVILFLPTCKRGRLPLKTPTMDVEWSKTLIEMKDKLQHVNYFIGHQNYNDGQDYKTLEEPLTGISDKDLANPNFHINYNLMEIVNSSIATKKNYEEIIKSLKAYLPFELLICSWTDELDIPEVFTHTKIKEALGFWETQSMLFYKTNGKEGIRGDAHWIPKMHKAFAEHIIKSYPQYFGYESKIL